MRIGNKIYMAYFRSNSVAIEHEYSREWSFGHCLVRGSMGSVVKELGFRARSFITGRLQTIGELETFIPAIRKKINNTKLLVSPSPSSQPY